MLVGIVREWGLWTYRGQRLQAVLCNAVGESTKDLLTHAAEKLGLLGCETQQDFHQGVRGVRGLLLLGLLVAENLGVAEVEFLQHGGGIGVTVVHLQNSQGVQQLEGIDAGLVTLLLLWVSNGWWLCRR